MMKKWKIGILFTAALLAALVTTAAVMQQEQQLLAGKLIRLHVVANSDSKEDQILKLRVRDAVLEVTAWIDNQDPAAEIQKLLPAIQQAAETCLREQGSTDPVRIQFGSERFPTRIYDSFSLPAGVYRSLRITIGEGKGHNWWCVVFPSICFQATAADLEAAAAASGMTMEEIHLITGETKGDQLKFKTLELLQALKDKLFE